MTDFDREVKYKQIEAAFYAIRKIARDVDVCDDVFWEGGADVHQAVRMIRSFCNDIEVICIKLSKGDN